MSKPIYKKKKINSPKNYSVPQELKIFLNSVISEISDPRNIRQEGCNLPMDEMAALKELTKLQKEKVIVIKACDKGAGVIILNYDEYMRSCYVHLTSFQSENKPYYTQVDEFEIERTKSKISNTLKEALSDGIISQDEHSEMIADEKGPGRFYCNFKVHKPHEPNKAPPERPITSGSG